MRVLIIKTSSLGDVIHTLPALSDAAKAIPGIEFDWVVEEAFAEIPAWHSAVREVIPVALRRWRKTPFDSFSSPEWRHCKTLLAKQKYDCVIDAQGLMKSAWLAHFVKASRYGLDWQSVREPLATLAYTHKIAVPKAMHAVERVRSLFAQSLFYDLPDARGNYGLNKERFLHSGNSVPSVVFLHGTTKDSKHWPECYWQQLAKTVGDQGFNIALPWGNDVEKKRAELIASASPQASVLPKLNLQGVASVLARAKAVVAVDTGLGHLSAALDTPTVSLYGPTSPDLVGAYGKQQIHLKASAMPALKLAAESIAPKEMAPITPEWVYQSLSPLLNEEPPPCDLD
jgi:heptosyltransferase-1